MAEDLIAREGWRKISLDFDGASLLNILKIFSQQSGLNFVAAPALIDKNVTLYLENVPLREALEKILNSNKLTYELDEDSNIFIVKELIRPEVDTVTKVYALKYAQLSGSPVNAAGQTAHRGLVEAVRDRMSTYGKLTEDTRTNSIIVTDVPYAMKEIEAAIQQLDVPIPQVMIEVEILDTKKEEVDKLGFLWNEANNLIKYTLPSHVFPSTSPFAMGVGGGSSSGGLVFGGPQGTTMSLQALRRSTETKILARPKILTLSNEKAEIKIAGKEVVSTTTTLNESGQVSSITAQFEDDIGVTLVVTPSVNIETGEITMVLEPKVKSTSGSTFSDATGNQFKNIDERSAKVKLVTKNNETIILGGLIRKDFSEIKTKVPLLGDIPFLGTLFRHRNKEPDRDSEILVFITPRIVDSGGIEQASSQANYNPEILAQREQSTSGYRKEEIDKELLAWDNY